MLDPSSSPALALQSLLGPCLDPLGPQPWLLWGWGPCPTEAEQCQAWGAIASCQCCLGPCVYLGPQCHILELGTSVDLDPVRWEKRGRGAGGMEPWGRRLRGSPPEPGGCFEVTGDAVIRAWRRRGGVSAPGCQRGWRGPDSLSGCLQSSAPHSPAASHLPLPPLPGTRRCQHQPRRGAGWPRGSCSPRTSQGHRAPGEGQHPCCSTAAGAGRGWR